MSIYAISFIIFLGSLVRYVLFSPKNVMISVLQYPETLTIREKKEHFIMIWKKLSYFWFIVGILAIIFQLNFVLYFIIGMYMTYIIKIIPEIKKEIETLDILESKIIELLMLKIEKERDEKA